MRAKREIIEGEFKVHDAQSGGVDAHDGAWASPRNIVEHVCGWIAFALVTAGLVAIRVWVWPWLASLTAEDYTTVYFLSCAVIGALGGVAIYIAAICQKGVVLGGSLGLIPAWIGGWIIAVGWPLILIVGLAWRTPWGGSVVGEWAAEQFERR